MVSFYYYVRSILDKNVEEFLLFFVKKYIYYRKPIFFLYFFLQNRLFMMMIIQVVWTLQKTNIRFNILSSFSLNVLSPSRFHT